MRNLLMFFGSCGHTTVNEVSDETWLRYATQPGFSAISELPPCPSRTGRRSRMVYVHPGRYCICLDCMKLDDEANKAEYDEFIADIKRQLRETFNAPFRFSHNFGIKELQHERNQSVIALGKKLLPRLTEDEILTWAMSPEETP